VPHLIEKTGFAALYRGFVKANLIHHLAHTGDAATIRKIGEAWKADLVPAPELPQAVERELARVYAISTRELKPEDLEPLKRFPPSAEISAALGLNYLRLWQPGKDWFAQAEKAFSAALDADQPCSNTVGQAARNRAAWLLILRAEARRSRLDYDGALADFDAALELDPDDALAWAFKSRVLFQKGTSHADLKVIDRAIALAPKEGWALAWRGEALRRLGDLKGAERDLRRALSLDPLYDQAYGWLSRVLEAQGRHAEALPLLEKGIALCPDFEKAYRPLVRALRGAGRVGDALEALDRAAALNHRNGWLGPWRVEGQLDAADAARSMAALDGWLEEHPDDARALRWKGEALSQLGRREEALTALDRSLALDPANPWARAWKGEALLALGMLKEARTELDAAVGLDPEYGRAWAWRGRARAAAGDWKGALSDFDEALGRRRVEYAWINAWRGEALLELGRAAQAKEALDGALVLDAARPEFLKLRARARHALRDLAGACEDLLRAEGGSWAALAQAESLRRAGDAAAALAALEDLPRDAVTLLLRYRLKAQLGVKAAHRDVDAAFRLDPKAGWLFGVEPLPEGAPEAWAFLQDASFAEDPACAPVWAYQGQARLQRGDAGGLSFLERAAELSPDSGWILAWLGEALRQAGKPELARVALDRAVESDPKYANAWGWRATLELASDPKAAEAALTRALKLQKTARFYKDRSLARRALGDIKGAAADMEEAARLNPDLSWSKPSEEALKDCPLPSWKAEMLLRLGRRDEARKLLKNAKTALELVWRAETDLGSAQAGKDLARALTLEPKLARAWLAKAEREQSAAAALRAARLGRYSAQYRLRAARILLKKGKRAQAETQARQALALVPGFGEAERFLQELSDPASPSLEFFTNYSCNAKCPFCFNPPDATKEQEEGLPFAELSTRLYTGFAEGYRGVKFIGGEATMRADLPKIVGLARKIGYRSIQLTTNGIRLADPAYARRLTALGVDSYRFSIHGHVPALHDELVRVPGALEKIEQAVKNLRPLGVRLGINYVLNAVNYKKLPETLLYFHETLEIDDIIVYFLRYQGFAELPDNEKLLALRFKQAAPVVRQAFEALKAKGFSRMPALIHFAPCVIPELEEHMLDWRRAPRDVDRVTLPDGTAGRIDDITNDGKAPVAACANCSKRRVCFGIEERYVERYGDREFKPV
jgi:tetratricopeptide (TPR) repeat protein